MGGTGLRIDQVEKFEADTVHRFQGRQRAVIILTTVLDETWRGRTGLRFADDPHLINVAVSRAVRRFILVTNYDMLPTSRHIRDLVGYIRYRNPHEPVVDSAVISMFDLLYRDYSSRLQPLADRLRHADHSRGLDGQQALGDLGPERCLDVPLELRMPGRPQLGSDRSICSLLTTCHSTPPGRGVATTD